MEIIGGVMEKTPERVEFEKFEKIFQERHLTAWGNIKYPEGDFNPQYSADNKKLNLLRARADEADKEVEYSRAEANELEQQARLRKKDVSVSGNVSIGGSFDREPREYNGCAVFGVVGVVVLMMFVFDFLIIIPALIWLLLVKLYLFPKIITNFERWTLFIATATLSVLVGINAWFNNGLATLTNIVAIISIAVLAVEIIYRFKHRNLGR
jgi:hypothetical protein